MIVGENARPGDIDVNPTKEKKLTNHRAATADDMVRLAPPRPVSLELALETIATDEVVEVTPKSVRLRKAQLDQTVRGRESKRARVGAAS
jgi:GTP-binding protein